MFLIGKGCSELGDNIVKIVLGLAELLVSSVMPGDLRSWAPMGILILGRPAQLQRCRYVPALAFVLWLALA